MSIPTSLIVVLLVVAWLVVLVPMVAKRRDKVPRSDAGGQGFRVLRRAQASLKRRPRRTPKAGKGKAAESATADAGGGQPARTAGRERTLVTVGAAAEDDPRDAAEEWAAVQSGQRPAPVQPAEYVPTDAPEVTADQPWQEWDDRVPAAPVQQDVPAADDRYPDAEQELDAAGAHWPAQADPAEPSVTEFPYAPGPRIPNEVDEQEWQEHAAAASAPAHRYEVDDDALRPTPRRRGRGGYDPEAAEATRAYKYRQRRRVTLVLAAATAVFAVVALLLASWLWVGAGISAVLLALYLTYLRRQVKIEAQIRQRRMERLQRARQIRPEYGRGRQPARAGRSAAGPGRTVVDLDDDDPTFDHLDPYDPPVTYRRASGQ